jgi:uncharacterized membrane protein
MAETGHSKFPNSSIEKLEQKLFDSAHSGNPVELRPEQAEIIAEVMHARYFSGPLPPPGLLREYESLVPGFTKTLLSELEKQGAHLRSLESTSLENDNHRANIGQILSFTIAALSLAAALWLGLVGANAWLAAATVAVGIGGPTAATLFADGISLRKPTDLMTAPEKLNNENGSKI